MLQLAAKVLAPHLAEELGSTRAANDEWISQLHPLSKSVLGNRRHCAAVRRLREQNDPRALIIDDRFLLSREAFNEEIQRVGTRLPVKATRVAADPVTPSAEDEEAQAAVERLGRRLSIVKGNH